MLLEHKVRHEAATVDLSFVGGITKAKQFLKIARRIRLNARKVGLLSFEFAHKGEWEKANRFRKAYDRLSELHSEIRERARSAMRQPEGLSFDAAPTPAAFSSVPEVAK